MKNYKFLIISAVTLIFLFSCDPHSDFKKIVINNTDYTLKIIGYSNLNVKREYAPYDSFLVNSKQSVTIREGGRLGTPGPCLFDSDSLVAVLPNNNNLKTTKDLNQIQSWLRKQSGNSAKGYFVRCEATINNSDIN